MIRLNELEHAENMKKNGFERECSLYELTIYAKWLRYLDKTYDEVEKELINFCEKHDKSFNYQIHYYKIDGALEKSKKYSLRIPGKTIVTKDEWEVICSTNDDKYRRVLFIMLVLSKYIKNHNTKINQEQEEDHDKSVHQNEYCLFNITDSEICNMAGVTFKPSIERDKMFAEFKTLGLADIVSRKSTFRYINFVNNESDPLIEVIDYRNIIFYYERQTGINIGVCKYCGKLFRQNRVNNAEYCHDHRGYQKVEKKMLKCLDCGDEFEVNGKVKNKKRCDICQKIQDKENNIKRVQKCRNKAKY